MSRKYRTYRKSLRIEAIKRMSEQGYKIAEAARSSGIKRSLLGTNPG